MNLKTVSTSPIASAAARPPQSRAAAPRAARPARRIVLILVMRDPPVVEAQSTQGVLLAASIAPETRQRARLGPRGLDLAIARFGMGDQLGDQAPRRGGDLLHRAVEGVFIGLGGQAEAAELAHELQGRIADLQLGGRGLEIEEGLDIAAHGWAGWAWRCGHSATACPRPARAESSSSSGSAGAWEAPGMQALGRVELAEGPGRQAHAALEDLGEAERVLVAHGRGHRLQRPVGLGHPCTLR
eukprot:Opistho-1_new@8972